MEEQFWMVLGTGAPTHRHPSRAVASVEAERLAKSFPDVKFYVLEAVAVVVKQDVQWTSLDGRNGNGDVPF